MKGLILSGGKGTRLRPITYTNAKQLIPVANKPILFYGIEAIVAAGITDIGIIVGETRDEIIEACGDGSKFGAKFTFIDQPDPLGLAHAVLTAEEFLKDDKFIMYLGDNLIVEGVSRFVEEFEKNAPHCQILLEHVKHPSHFGVAELENGRVVRLVEKPKEPKSDLALVGVYLFDKNIFDAARSIKPSFRNELEITDAIQYLMDKGFTVNPHTITGWWKDTGNVEDLLEANRLVLDSLKPRCDGTVDSKSEIVGKVVLEAGCEIRNSVVRGPAIIGRNVKIVDSYIGSFTSINFDTEIIGSEIEHSVVLANCRLENVGVRIEDSLIGRDVRIGRSDAKPKALRFVLGDNSEVGLI
ncbi:MAG: glucose-1-phosphate thymidylyltransferase [Candidatus Coatesbacteria bacterium]|nr:glucose-1-phosphate thymidylyltransferase [Candidatus Coatesbacteria bacterium]